MKKLAALLLVGCMVLVLLTGCSDPAPVQPADKYDAWMTEIQKNEAFGEYTKKRDTNADVVAWEAHLVYSDKEKCKQKILSGLKDMGIQADAVYFNYTMTMGSELFAKADAESLLTTSVQEIQTGTGNGKTLYFGFYTGKAKVANMTYDALFTVFYTVKE